MTTYILNTKSHISQNMAFILTTCDVRVFIPIWAFSPQIGTKREDQAQIQIYC